MKIKIFNQRFVLRTKFLDFGRNMGIKMGKVRWKWIIGLFAVVLAVGCGGKEQEAEPTPTPEVERPAFAADDNVDEDVWTWPKSGLKEELPKRDTAGQEDYNGMNRMLFDDLAKNHRSLFCVDADTGVVYFVNQNKDWYIYRIRDKETELAVAMPAKELYAYGGSLYFMTESYNGQEDIQEGDIYCYTPKDGKVEPVYAAGTIAAAAGEDVYSHWMWVDETGIYFCRKTRVPGGGPLAINNYYLSFGSKEPVNDPLGMAVYPGWGNYYYRPYSGPVSLISRTEGEADVRELSPDRPYSAYIMGDKIYYILWSDITRMSVLDFSTGEQEDYSIREQLKELYYVPTGNEKSEKDYVLTDSEMEELCKEFEGSIITQAFSATEQYLWMVVKGNALLRIDKQTKETTYVRVNHIILALYTDGEELYGMCAPKVGETTAMARILTDQFVYDKFLGQCITVEYLTD